MNDKEHLDHTCPRQMVGAEALQAGKTFNSMRGSTRGLRLVLRLSRTGLGFERLPPHDVANADLKGPALRRRDCGQISYGPMVDPFASTGRKTIEHSTYTLIETPVGLNKL